MQPPSRPGPAFEAFRPIEPGDPVLIGGYRVLARIGSGRLGEVYLGAAQSGRRLAIKSVRADLAEDEAFRRRFKREIAAAQRARGPFLATVVDGHAEGARPWVASEFVPGPTLADAVHAHGPLPVPAVRALMGALAQALQTLHDADIVHGDLRPSNVLLTEDGPRTVDFGSLEHETSASGDVFMLGGVALFAATGHGAFPRPFGDEPPDLSGCPDALRGPIERCLAERPEERPEPRELAAELEAGPPGPGWLPPEITALLPAYAAEPPRPDASPLPTPAAPAQPLAPSRPPGPPPSPPPGTSSSHAAPRDTRPDVAAPAPAPAPAAEPDAPAATAHPARPNFVVPEQPPQTDPSLSIHAMEPVMGTYRHDLVVALGIGGGAFGLLVLILLLVFLN
ncbi:serine/threonine-protein kinase [Spirillospora sp. CA-255316]